CGRWPEYGPAWLLLGQLLIERGEIEAALEVLTQALMLAPDDAAAHVALGDAQRRTGEIEEARTHFQTALALDAQNADAHVQLARLLSREGDTDSAMDEFHHALRIDPDHLQAHFYLGLACQRLRHLNKAAVHLRHVVDASPGSHWAWAALADCSEANGLLEEAYTYYVHANEVAQGHEYYYFHMGRLLKDLKRYHEAIPVLRQAVKVQPNNTEAYKLLAAVSAIAFFGGR
ncbi:MAG: tetratricopeptide repeat protein, partial [Ardenticatenaceae bacterium]